MSTTPATPTSFNPFTKPVVRYRKDVGVRISADPKDWDYGCLLQPIDHPNPVGLVSNRSVINTSKVVSYDPNTGKIETLNTIYLPSED